MGARSYIVRGKGNQDSFHSCSHGAGRVMSRGHAKKRITVEDHMLATAGVECRKDKGVIDESPAAYKSIDAVMAAQEDLVDVVSEQENSFNIVARRPRGAGQQHTGAHLDAGHRRLPFKQILEAKSGSANSDGRASRPSPNVSTRSVTPAHRRLERLGFVDTRAGSRSSSPMRPDRWSCTESHCRCGSEKLPIYASETALLCVAGATGSRGASPLI